MNKPFFNERVLFFIKVFHINLFLVKETKLPFSPGCNGIIFSSGGWKGQGEEKDIVENGTGFGTNTKLCCS